ncbi:flavodoxin family protein [Propionispora hippei]|uniref:NADPH-dependent FMN reductase n=1 Tax=Propionispora hippei DSM 15287 TaxID=1123003 RepID=A0A1M6LII6_9FIRM|nr:flavodoxin family protein [Propionispora hippei]SHJ71009.1 NADPH-dependent FMN reductase [Propionispora hippei DSM 15287]
MKKVIAVNGSPRKQGNTAVLLEKALEGARAGGAETELIHLYDLHFTGCRSCFACKLKGGKSYGKCAVADDLQPVSSRIEAADALILGSPVYLGTATGEMRSFMERLIFPYLVYDEAGTSLFSKKVDLGFIYTMNVSEEVMKEWGYDQYFSFNEKMAGRIFGRVESLYVTDTYQFSDYSKYESSRFDAAHKLKRHQEVFPVDCESAFQMGSRLTGGDGDNGAD